jgi:hypothetical protein
MGNFGAVGVNPAHDFTRQRQFHFAKPLVDLQQVLTMRVATVP